MEFLWLVAVVIGPLVLGGIIAYALLMRRRLSARERARRDDATENLYRSERETSDRP